MHRFQRHLHGFMEHRKSAGHLRNLQTMCRCTVAQIFLESGDSGAGRFQRGLHFPNVDFKPVQLLPYTRDAVIIHVIFEALYLVADVLQTVHQFVVRALSFSFCRECFIRRPWNTRIAIRKAFAFRAPGY